MTPTADRSELTRAELDTIAWQFLRSEFTGATHADWPIDRRLDAFLLHYGPTGLLADGTAYNELLEHVMTNIGPALRNGVLPP
jgi:hypothetical protein